VNLLDWFRKVFLRQPPAPEVRFEAPPVLQALPAYTPLVAPQPPSIRKVTSSSTLPGFQNAGSELGFGFGAPEGENLRNKVRDAFSPSLPITNPRLLAGRTEALQTLIRAIEDLKLHVVIYGDRGIGKTSLLQILRQLAESAKYQVVYHSCGEDARFADMFRGIAGEIPMLYYQGFDVAGASDFRNSGSLSSLLPSGEFNVSQLSDTFAQLSNTRLLIMLDEFDRSPPGEFRRNIAQLIKNLSDRSVKVQLVIAGVAGNLADLVEYLPSIRRNILGFRVPELKRNEVQQMVSIGEEISGLIFDPTASEDIIAMANGSPYLASLLSQYASFSAVDRGAAIVAPLDVHQAAAKVAGELRARLTEASASATDRAIADGWGPTLYALANHSMHQMGCLDPDQLEGVFTDRSFTEVAEQLEKNYALAVPAFDEKAGRYRFREEGLGSYIWLQLADYELGKTEVVAEV
jgi:hypothetical protein